MKILMVLMLCLFIVPFALAELDFDEGLSEEEEDLIDEILEPVMKVYNILKYVATIIGVLMIVFAGISFVTAGGQTTKKDNAKHMITGVVVGLIIIWVAPLMVNLIFS